MAEKFDLLGDPIPENFGRRGRPEHIASSENRCKVMMLLAFGWTNSRIAGALGITGKTLAKHYFRELRVRDEAKDRVEASTLLALWKQVESGNVGAIKMLSERMDRFDLARRTREYSDAQEDTRPEPKAGKKEAARIAAETAGDGTEWGEDLLGPDGNRLI